MLGQKVNVEGQQHLGVEVKVEDVLGDLVATFIDHDEGCQCNIKAAALEEVWPALQRAISSDETVWRAYQTRRTRKATKSPQKKG